MEVLQAVWRAACFYFRPLIKWFLRKTTRLSELQRICHGETPGAPRCLAVERSLALTRSPLIRGAVEELWATLGADSGGEGDGAVDEAIRKVVDAICQEKQIKKQLYLQFVQSLSGCLRQIWGYRRLCQEVEALKSTPYDSNDPDHEEKLMTLWRSLNPDGPALEARVTKQWQDIGFQGSDPKTDFRGMGMLGLEDLLYFAGDVNTAARHILSHSHHPQYGYSFAVVGINITLMAYKLLNEGAAKTQMYNVTDPGARATLSNFHHFYSYLYVEFDKFWLQQKPETVMEFNRIRDLFENNIRTLLADCTTVLRINPVVDTV